MILTINKDELKRTLKSFFGVASKAADSHYTNLVVLRSEDGIAHVMAGSGSSFALAQLNAEVEDAGIVCVPYELYELARAAKNDDTLRLTVGKSMTIEGLETGFKARLAIREATAEYPFDKMLSVFDAGVSDYAVSRTDSMETLVNLTLRFVPSTMKMPWARFTAQAGEFYGESSPNELGSVDHYPLSDQAEGEFSVAIPVTGFSTLLTFAGTYTRIGMSIGAKGFVIVDDPEDSSWKGLIGTVKIDAG